MKPILFSALLLLLATLLIIFPRYIKYRRSSYKTASGNSFFRTITKAGDYGEFLTFYYLEKLKDHKRLMTNLYLPKSNGTTTEVDLIMICETGIYVFESKNYSGWIFGDEKNKNWMQTLPNKQKNRFFNPIWQNGGHITALKLALGKDSDELYHSYIVFSERCTLKKIQVNSPNVKVMKRNDLLRIIKKDMKSSPKVMTKDDVDRLYLALEKYTLADDETKRAHIESIKAIHRS